jgi:dUTP pyrophosphatase
MNTNEIQGLTPLTTTSLDSNVQVNIGLASTAVCPKYMTTGAAGADLSSLNRVALMPNQVVLVDTGVSLALREGTAGMVYLRSSIAREGIVLCNGVGVIDRDYRGTIKVLVMNTTQTTIVFNKGDRIAQLVITPIITATFYVMSELDSTNRGNGSFGSTGLS